jgi:hypothetical protein
LTVNVWLAMVIVPLRAAPVFAATLNPTGPFPVPDAPDVTASHVGALLIAVHVQPAPAVTVTVPVVALAVTFWLGGAIEYMQGAAWLTVNVWPAIVIVPLRADPVLAATLNPTDPLPVPDAPDVTLIHCTPLVAVHVHPAPAVTVTVPVVALAATSW